MDNLNKIKRLIGKRFNVTWKGGTTVHNEYDYSPNLLFSEIEEVEGEYRLVLLEDNGDRYYASINHIEQMVLC